MEKVEEFESFWTLWWRRQEALKTPNQETAETKQDTTPTDQTPHQEEEAATLPQHNKTQEQQVKTNMGRSMLQCTNFWPKI